MNPRPFSPRVSRYATWEDCLVGYPGMIVALLWGLAESTYFFIVPDVFLSYLAILDWRRTWKHLLASVAGALLGGAFLFHWSTVSPNESHRAIARVPFVRQSMFTKVDDGFRAHGMWSILLGSVSGIPYKLYAVEAPKFCRQVDFLIVTPPTRLVRFFLVWAIFAAAGSRLRRAFSCPRWKCTMVHVVVWIVVYAVYWGRIVYY